MNPYIIMGSAIGGLVVGAVAVWFGLRTAGRNTVARARAEAEQLRQSAAREAEEKGKRLELEAKSRQLELRRQFEKEEQATRNELKASEQRLSKREDTLDRKLDTLGVKEKHLEDIEGRLTQREKSITVKDEQLDKVLADQRQQLLQITSLSQDQAREMRRLPQFEELLPHQRPDAASHRRASLIADSPSTTTA